MSGLDIPMFPKWDVGDTQNLSEDDIDRLHEADRYDSYNQTYIVDGARWKVTHETHQANGQCQYVLECIEVGVSGQI